MKREFRRVLAPLRAQLDKLAELSGTLLRRVIPGIGESGSLTMCPSCGRITSKYKKLCLECGESLKAVI
jgi:hypothetical protein